MEKVVPWNVLVAMKEVVAQEASRIERLKKAMEKASYVKNSPKIIKTEQQQQNREKTGQTEFNKLRNIYSSNLHYIQNAYPAALSKHIYIATEALRPGSFWHSR